MVDEVRQTRQNGRVRTQSAGTRVERNAAAFARDVVTLLELQGQLAAQDARDAAAQSARAGKLLAAGAILALGSIPVLLSGAALSLTAAGLSAAAAFLIVGGLAVAVAVACGWYGYSCLTGPARPFDRSRRELAENLRWIKAALASRAAPAESDTHETRSPRS